MNSLNLQKFITLLCDSKETTTFKK